MTKILAHPHKPCAIFLSFADPTEFVSEIKAADCQLWCQVFDLAEVRHVSNLGADVIIVQNGGGDGHGALAHKALNPFTFIQEAVDWLATHNPQTLLITAGGIADSRSLSAALTLGADVVLLGTTF